MQRLFRSFLDQQRFGCKARAKHFVGGQGYTLDRPLRSNTPRRHNQMSRHLFRLAVFPGGNIQDWDDHATKVEDTHKKSRSEWYPRQNGPFHNLFDLGYGKAKEFASGSEQTVLVCREPL
jgi:hypothetical protein